MRKYVKYAISLVLVLLLTFSLCSCNKLDDARARQVFYNEDGSLSFEGNTYVHVSFESLTPDYYNCSLISFENLCLTESDVPVLLSDILGTTGHIDGTHTVILDDYNTENAYIREDKKDEVLSAFRNNEFSGYYHTSYSDGEWVPMPVGPALAAALDKALAMPPVNYAPQEKYRICDIYSMDKNGIFLKRAYDVFLSDGNCYVEEFPDCQYHPLEITDEEWNALLSSTDEEWNALLSSTYDDMIPPEEVIYE